MLQYVLVAFPQFKANSVGFDIANKEFTAFGAPSQRISFTSLRDVGRAVARLAMLVTDSVRAAGSTVSFEDVCDIVARLRGIAPAQIRTDDLAMRN